MEDYRNVMADPARHTPIPPKPEEATRVLLVRHCEAEGNTMGVFQGSSDCGISGNGEQQLELLGLRCRNMRIDALYTSPLKRAYQTAEAVNRYHNLPIHTDVRLMELDGGDYEGLPWAELPNVAPEQDSNWYTAPQNFIAPNGESMHQVYDRVWEALLSIVQKNRGKTACVASHGCAIRNMLCHAKGWPLDRLNDVDWCDNTAISVIDFDREDIPHLVLQNDATHLTPDVSVFARQTWWKRENLERKR